MDKTARQVEVRMVNVSPQDRRQTKGTVLLVCLRCVDTLVLVLKHAEGMSLRCDVICALAYCGRHESSHIIKAHTDSTKFNKMIICGNLWWFVGGKNFCNKIFV